MDKKNKNYSVSEHDFESSETISGNYLKLKKLEYLPKNDINLNPLLYFQNFLNDFILENILLFTNNYLIKKNKKEILKVELRNFFYILIYMSIVKYSNIKDYWSKNQLFNNQIISKLMSREKFLLILRNIHFNYINQSNN